MIHIRLCSSGMINRVAVCPILGIVTTVVVAWGCWQWVNPRTGTMVGSLRSGGTDFWSYWVFHRPGATLVQRSVQFPSGWPAPESNLPEPEQLPQWSAVRRPPRTEERQMFPGTFVEDARGWPFLCLYSETRIPPTVVPTSNRNVIRIQHSFEKGSLPNRLIWPGFLANTAIFAAAWMMLLIAPRLAKRHLRRRRGACAACGYDLRFTPHSVNCPECGAESKI